MSKSPNSHHAYLLIGDKLWGRKELDNLFGPKLFGSPDFFLLEEELFGIEEARRLGELSNRKAFDQRKIFFITPKKITVEAQNALLKTFEEPIPDTHFLLLVRDEALILPTLKSRMAVLYGKLHSSVGEVEKFLKLNLSDRLDFAKKFADDERDLSAFLDELLMLKRDKNIYKMRLFSADRTASSRLILEHLALVI